MSITEEEFEEQVSELFINYLENVGLKRFIKWL